MYPIEVKLASKNAWFTPAESNNYYAARYSREGITIHWWGDGTGADNHDNIVNYFLGQAQAGIKSVNYVVSDNKITMMVDPDNVAWCSGPGNPTTISIEHQPTLGAEGYKKSGWLVWQLEKRYGHRMNLYPHNKWQQTSCPGTISLDRIRQEADKWAVGAYNPAPTPPPPTTAQLQWEKLPNPVDYTCNKQPTKLWNFNQTSWSGFGNGVKDFNAGDKVTIFGKCFNRNLGATYLVTQYSFERQITNGFNEVDLTQVVQPVPPPEPTPPPPPPKPEWEANLRDIDETKYWLTQDQELIDITTGKPTGTKSFKKDDEFDGSALTVANGVEYRITEYSYSKGIFNGVPIGSLTLTPPGLPDVPPVPEQPDLNEQVNWLVRAVKAILAFFHINI